MFAIFLFVIFWELVFVGGRVLHVLWLGRVLGAYPEGSGRWKPCRLHRSKEEMWRIW